MLKTVETVERPDIRPGLFGTGLGWVMSVLAILFLLMDAIMKFVQPPVVISTTRALGWPADSRTLTLLGAILLVSTLLYALPRTALLGAILLTGYLGGAVATHARIYSPLLSHTLFGVYLGIFVWGGLWLRYPALRSLRLAGREVRRVVEEPVKPDEKTNVLIVKKEI
jgi:Na+-transporting methylmalonyl-CoA/oxaloacetate decarboxylase gamma subunit